MTYQPIGRDEIKRIKEHDDPDYEHEDDQVNADSSDAQRNINEASRLLFGNLVCTRACCRRWPHRLAVLQRSTRYCHGMQQPDRSADHDAADTCRSSDIDTHVTSCHTDRRPVLPSWQVHDYLKGGILYVYIKQVEMSPVKLGCCLYQFNIRIVHTSRCATSGM